MSEIFKPLYPPEGGPPHGFSCTVCGGVTRTELGMFSHLRNKHKINLQEEMFTGDEGKANQ